MLVKKQIKITYRSYHLCVSARSLGAIGGDLGKLWVSEFLLLMGRNDYDFIAEYAVNYLLNYPSPAKI